MFAFMVLHEWPTASDGHHLALLRDHPDYSHDAVTDGAFGYPELLESISR